MLDTKARPSRKMLTASTRPVTVIRASGGPDVGEDGHVQVLDRAAGHRGCRACRVLAVAKGLG